MTDIERSDIQGNILDGYSLRFTVAKHIFARFEAGRARRALAGLVSRITSANGWGGAEPKSTFNLGLTHAGLAALGLPREWLDAFPLAFREGMRKRAPLLGDSTDLFDRRWRAGLPVHLWISIYAKDPSTLTDEGDVVLKGLIGDVDHVFELDGQRLLDSQQRSREHFGFRDALSQPAVEGMLKATVYGQGVLGDDGQWRPIAAGEFVLGQRDETGEIAEFGPAPALIQNGTFAVFRQLEQDVPGFRAYLEAQAAALQSPGIDSEWLAARMVGRRKDGTPLTHPEGTALSEDAINAFSFEDDQEGRVCPLGAHIRRTNPRGGHVFHDSFSRHRILRRGIPYTFASDGQKPSKDERGLLFVAFNADLERQFEFLQRRYMNDGAASRQGEHRDPLVGAAESRKFVIPGDGQSDRDTMICGGMPQFVVCRGGEYFFVPGLDALRVIAENADAAPPDVEIRATRDQFVARARNASQGEKTA